MRRIIVNERERSCRDKELPTLYGALRFEDCATLIECAYGRPVLVSLLFIDES